MQAAQPLAATRVSRGARGRAGPAPPGAIHGARPRRRPAPVATLSYKTDSELAHAEQQQWQQQRRPEQQGEPWDHQGVAELRREVEQLQADNAELQAELQHLAATLRAALAASPDCASGAAAASLGGSVDLSADGVQHLDGFLPAHNHTHLQLGHGHGACHESHSLTASMLSSVDTPPPALEHALDEQADSQGPNGSPAGPAAGLAAPPVYHQPSAVARATLSCSMQHPGSICCTKLSSTVDPSGAACTISLHTTARCTADDSTVHRHLEPEELRALAAHALVGAAHSFSQAATADYRKRLGPPQDVAGTHAELNRLLQEGVVICAERSPPSQFDHKSYLLTLQDPNTAVRVRAIYKPRVYGDAGGWHRTPMEWVAYRLNLLLDRKSVV